MIVPVSFGGHAINSMPYQARFPEPDFGLPDASPISADTDAWLPAWVGNQMQPRTLSLEIEIVDLTGYETRLNELHQWFDPQRGQPGYLIALWQNEPRLRRLPKWSSATARRARRSDITPRCANVRWAPGRPAMPEN